MRRFDPEPLSRTGGIFRHCDARACLIAAFILLIGISLERDALALSLTAVVLIAGAVGAKLSPGRTIVRYAAIMTLPAFLTATVFLTGSRPHAGLLLGRAALSGGVLTLLTGVTSFPDLLDAMRRIGMPALLVETIQFVYRYLFLLVDQTVRMRNAILCRGGEGSFRAVAGSAGVLFARSYARAEGLHRAMLARNYDGKLPGRAKRTFAVADALLLIVVLAVTAFMPLLRLLTHV